MKSSNSCRLKGRSLGLALFGVLAFSTSSAFAQQENDRPLLDAPLASVLMEFDSSQLTGDQRRAFDVLTLIIADVDHANSVDQRNGYLMEFLARSQDFLKAQPNSVPLWLLRADAALELNNSNEGRESARRLIELKAGDSNDGKMRRVLAMLDRRGWIGTGAPLVEGAQTMMPVIDPKKPRARPALSQPHTRPAIFTDNPMGTSNIGPVAYDPKWRKYGDYLHNMMEAIQTHWDQILTDSRTQPPSGTHVTIRFNMNQHGKILDILSVDSTSSEPGRQACLTALTTTEPFGEWSNGMVATLGNLQELAFRFYYE
jgi:hypothetical protein